MIYALFDDAFAAYRAVSDLRSAGLSDRALSLLSKEFERGGSVTTDGPAPTTEPDSASPGVMNADAKHSYEVAGGLAAGALLTSLIVPGLGLVLGGGALAAGLAGAAAQNSGPSAPEFDVRQVLIGHGVDATAAETMNGALASDGAVLELDPSGFGGLSQADVVQSISNHGGRIAWGANSDSPALRQP